MAAVEFELTSVLLYQMGWERQHKTIPAVNRPIIDTKLI
jgi:hypothetical protein